MRAPADKTERKTNAAGASFGNRNMAPLTGT
jgi:hypothetical protein